MNFLSAINEAANAGSINPKETVLQLFLLIKTEIDGSATQYNSDQIDSTIRKEMAEAGLPANDNPATFGWLSEKFQK